MRDDTNTQCKFQAEKCEFLEDEKKSIPFCLLYKYQTIVNAMIHSNFVYFIGNFNNIIRYNWDAYGWKHRYSGDSIHVFGIHHQKLFEFAGRWGRFFVIKFQQILCWGFQFAKCFLLSFHLETLPNHLPSSSSPILMNWKCFP